MHLGFIGLGTMGASMAANLQKTGHSLVVHDARPSAAEPHLAAGARWADTPRQVAGRAARGPANSRSGSAASVRSSTGTRRCSTRSAIVGE